MVDSRLFLACLNRILVTVGASGCNVAARQHESRLFVTSQGERRGMVSVESMALLALIEVRRRRKLGCMSIRVTVRA